MLARLQSRFIPSASTLRRITLRFSCTHIGSPSVTGGEGLAGGSPSVYQASLTIRLLKRLPTSFGDLRINKGERSDSTPAKECSSEAQAQSSHTTCD